MRLITARTPDYLRFAPKEIIDHRLTLSFNIIDYPTKWLHEISIPRGDRFIQVLVESCGYVRCGGWHDRTENIYWDIYIHAYPLSIAHADSVEILTLEEEDSL